MARFPHSLYGRGVEPDPRFSLANERTFLAWIRTALALFAGGLALEALELPHHPGFRAAAALLFVALGLLSSVRAWLGWRRIELSLRLEHPLPGLSLGLLLTGGVMAAMILVVLGLYL